MSEMLLRDRPAPAFVEAISRRLLGALPVPALRHFKHWQMIGTFGDFQNPTTFNEKVNWRILYDRRDRIAAACDKLRMKQMARAAYPGTDLLIPETFWAGTDLRDAPALATLPPCVLKPNHSSGQVILDPQQHDLTELTRRTAEWWTRTPVELGEWGYTQAQPLLLLEQRIPAPDAAGLPDYKFYVFDGRIELIQVNRGRFGAQTATFLDARWNRLPVKWRIMDVADEPPPPELDAMLDLASALGADWDFIRVDLYAVDGAVWFGEYTPYPGGGLLRYDPIDFDREQGLCWKLPDLAG
ncbi:hypothetical protein MMUR_40880 [Mycolicibacterium murale]|uniref:Glycosyl transferase n=2 Tax=Mycolicibacterium murale TaxID=182220 RepID=A0A7I9WQD5_9MYCO|nr:hypothetical protein MMUR_40880 [Mycolicibacterium murale]